MPRSSVYIKVGEVVGVWGVKGWIKLHSFTRERLGIAEYEGWYLSSAVPRRANLDLSSDTDKHYYDVINCRAQGQGIAAQLEGVSDRDTASSLVGSTILVRQEQLPKLDAGEFYWHELVGLCVSNSDGELGIVDSLIETGANDVLVVKPRSANGEAKVDILIPYVKDVVMEIDLEQQSMTVEWDPSFLE